MNSCGQCMHARYISIIMTGQRPSRLQQIQAYTTVLMDNNQAYQLELHELRAETSALRNELESVSHRAMVSKHQFQEEICSLRSLYEQQTHLLVTELKDILTEREHAERAHRAIIDELCSCTDSQAKSKRHLMDELEKTYMKQIRQLTTKIDDYNQQYQKEYSTHTMQKNTLLQSIDQLHYALKQQKRHSSALQADITLLKEQINQEKNKYAQASKELQECTHKYMLLEQEKNNVTVELKRNNNRLRDELSKTVEQMKKSQAAAEKYEQQAILLIQRLDTITNENNIVTSEYNSICDALKEKDTKCTSIEHQLTRVNDLFTREQRRLTELIRLLQIDNSKLACANESLSKDKYIRETEEKRQSEIISHLEVEKTHYAKSVLELQEQINESNKKQMECMEVIEELELQCKSLREQLIIEKQHLKTVEIQLAKYTRRTEEGKHYSNHNNDNYNSTQIKQIQQHYQYALREKENVFKQKISHLQGQIKQIRDNK